MGRIGPGPLRGSAALLAGLVLVPAGTLAVVKKSSERPLPSPGSDAVKTRCGEGKVATGGGYAIEANGIRATGLRSAPAGRKRWAGRMHAFAGPDSSWRNVALCRARERGAVTLEAEAVPVETDFAEATARCPGEKQTVGGGFRVTPAPEDAGAGIDSALTIRASERRNRWRVWRVFAGGDQVEGGKLKAFAVCEDRAMGKVKPYAQYIPLEPGLNTAKAKCRRGRRVVSGGFRWQGAVGVVLVSRPAGKRAWKVSFQADSLVDPGQPANLKVTAYCR